MTIAKLIIGTILSYGFIIQIFKTYKNFSDLKFLIELRDDLIDFHNSFLENTNLENHDLHDKLGFAYNRYYKIIDDKTKMYKINKANLLIKETTFSVRAFEFLIHNYYNFLSKKDPMYDRDNFINLIVFIDLKLKNSISELEDSRSKNIFFLFFIPMYLSNAIEQVFDYISISLKINIPKKFYSLIEFLSTIGGVIAFFLWIYETFLKK